MAQTVLVVEDNELNMRLFHDILETQGLSVLQSRDGLQAVELAREHRPDLILMDIQLPYLSGLDVIQLLKRDTNLSHIPIIAITAFAMHGDDEKLIQAGCSAYMAKPISLNNFISVIQQNLPTHVATDTFPGR